MVNRDNKEITLKMNLNGEQERVLKTSQQQICEPRQKTRRKMREQQRENERENERENLEMKVFAMIGDNNVTCEPSKRF